MPGRRTGEHTPSLQPRRRLEVTVLTHNQALQLSSANHPLTDDVRKQLIEVVLGHTGLCDEVAARADIEWMRDRIASKESGAILK
jgi:hypothetical protein